LGINWHLKIIPSTPWGEGRTAWYSIRWFPKKQVVLPMEILATYVVNARTARWSPAQMGGLLKNVTAKGESSKEVCFFLSRFSHQLLNIRMHKRGIKWNIDMQLPSRQPTPTDLITEAQHTQLNTENVCCTLLGANLL